MIKISKKYKKYLALLIAAMFIISTLAVTMDGFFRTDAKAADRLNSDEQKIADDISNMTGVKVERILELKNRGKNWNEILNYLKNNNEANIEGQKEKRDKTLNGFDIGSDYIEKLKSEGFTENEIMEAKILVERVVFQLKEIVNVQNNDKQDTSAFSDLLSKIDSKSAVYLMLKLKTEFGGIEAVLDEYLFALQAGIKLEDYLKDKKAYERDKTEKGAGMSQDKVITMALIESKMLEKVQSENQANKNRSIAEDGNKKDKVSAKTDGKVELPEAPVHEQLDVKPANPRDEVLKEIGEIKKKGLDAADIKDKEAGSR